MAGVLKYPQYASVEPFFAPQPAWAITDIDKVRLQSYEAYERIYWSSPETFNLIARSEDQVPNILLPGARKLIEAKNRFLAVDFDWYIEGTDGNLQAAMQNLHKREKMYKKFAQMKRYGLIRGDAVWHVTADDTKLPGTRISVHHVDPSHYFPIFEDETEERVIGVHLVTPMRDPRDPNKLVARRQTYRRAETGRITSSLSAWEMAGWDDRNLAPNDMKPVAWNGSRDEFELPDPITQIPVYHIANEDGSGHFGSSELRGIEGLMSAANQSISDEDLTLVMQGLGVYWTNGGSPVDDEGNEVPMDVSPGSMFELGDGQSAGRLTGVTSVAPFLDHINFLLDQGGTGIGVPDIAAGKVDVTIAESGISLKLQLAPLIVGNAEKELEILGVQDQMYFDLKSMWYPAYEGQSFAETAQVLSITGDPMPKNRDAEINEIALLYVQNLITLGMAIGKLGEWGYEYSATDIAELGQKELDARATLADPFGERLDIEGQTTDEPAA